jgi:hypothetical protein
LKTRIPCDCKWSSGYELVAASTLIVIVLHVLLAGAALAADDAPPDNSGDWKAVTREDGVTVWERSGEGSLPVFHGTTTMNAFPCEVLAVIHDVGRHTQWMKDCVEAYRIGAGSSEEYDVYNRTKGYPWLGVQDRDAVLHVSVDFTAAPEEIYVRFENVEREGHGPVVGVTRMPKLTGYYRLVSGDTAGKMQVDYRVDADLGGNVPAWIVRRTVEALPLDTLVNLRAQLKRARSSDVYLKEIRQCRMRLGEAGAPAILVPTPAETVEKD